MGLVRELVNAIAQEPIEALVALGGDPAARPAARIGARTPGCH